MPIYEYACRCGHEFEELVIRSGDQDRVACRSCGGTDVKRLMSRPAAAAGDERARSGGRGCAPVG